MNLIFFNFIHNLSGKNSFFDIAGVFFGWFFTIFLIGMGIMLFLKKKNLQAVLFLLVTIGFSLIVSFLLKRYFHTPRPFEVLGFIPLPFSANSFSFPSDNAAMAASLIPLTWREGWRWRVFFIIGAFLVGFGRIFVGVHWPIDIVGGAILGLISGLTVSNLYDILLIKRKTL